MNPIEFYKENKYLLLEEEMPIELANFNELRTYFNGYKKVIYSIMFRYFKFPVWRTLVIKDLNAKSLEVLDQFSTSASSFFVRADTFKDRIDNPSIKSCPAKDLVEGVKGMKTIEDRFIVILAQPDNPYQEHINLANCRTGIINGEEIQEWTGPGFSEYHLAKDKFPHKATVHAYVKVAHSDFNKIYIADPEKYKNDADNVFFSVGAALSGLKKELVKNYKDLTGIEIKGKEPLNDELLFAYEHWLLKFGSTKEEELIKLGVAFHKNIKPVSPLLKQLSRTTKWCPSKKQMETASTYLQDFIKKAKKLGIDPKEKIVTMSFNKEATKSGLVFWDVFNLIK